MNGVSVISLAVAASIAATGNGTAVNVGDYHGLGKIVLNSGPTNAGTSITKLQHSEDGSTNWEDVPGAVFAAVGTTASQQDLMFNTDRFRKFVRAVDTLAGGANAVVRSVSLVCKKQYN